MGVVHAELNRFNGMKNYSGRRESEPLIKGTTNALDAGADHAPATSSFSSMFATLRAKTE